MNQFDNYVSGIDSLDFDIYSNHRDVYNELLEMEEKMIEEGRIKFVGEKYKHPPRDTLPELNSLLKVHDKKIESLNELQTPTLVLELYEEERNKVFEKIKNKDFIGFKDTKDLDYKLKYEEANKKFYNSPEFKKLLKVINEKKEEIAGKYVDLSKYSRIDLEENNQ